MRRFWVRWTHSMRCVGWKCDGSWRLRAITSTTGGNGGSDVGRRVEKARRAQQLVPVQDAVQEVALPTAMWTPEEQKALVTRAYDGDKSVLPELRAMLDAHPEVVRAQGDLPRDAHLAMTHAVAGDDVGLPEVMARRAAQVRADLEGAHPSPLERLLCERVATCWLAVYLLDAATMLTISGQRPPARVLEHHERIKDSAQKRYLEACVALAKVRRLLQPSMQVNIAQAGAQQLNVSRELPLLGESAGK